MYSCDDKATFSAVTISEVILIFQNITVFCVFLLNKWSHEHNVYLQVRNWLYAGEITDIMK